MNELIKILSKYSLADVIKTEERDRQFLAIKKMNHGLSNSKYFFPLIIANSLIGYQLSGTGEEYWEEFTNSVINFDFGNDFNFTKLIDFFQYFLPKSKCNKRLLNMKIPRLAKTKKLFQEFMGNEEFYYENLTDFQNLLYRNQFGFPIFIN